MKPASRSLRAGALAVLAGNGVFNACRLLAIVLLAKNGSSEILGQFETGVALAAPVVLFFAAELRSVYVTDTQRKISLATYRRLRWIGVAGALVVLTALIAGGNWALSVPAGLLLAAACFQKVTLHAGEIEWGVFQQHERLDLLGISNALRGGAMLAIFAAACVFLNSAGPETQTLICAAAVFSTACAWWLISLLFDRARAQALHADAGRVERAALWQLARSALPLGIVALLISLCDNLPRLFVRAQYDGAAALGRLGALAYVPMAAHFVVLQLGLAASQRLANRFHSDRRAFVVLASQLIAIALGLGVGAFGAVWLLGPRFIAWLFTPEYAREYDAFLMLMAAQCVLLVASMLGYVLTQTRRFWVQVAIHSAVLGVTAAATAAWVPADPVGGAAGALMCRAIMQTLLYGAALGWAIFVMGERGAAAT